MGRAKVIGPQCEGNGEGESKPKRGYWQTGDAAREGDAVLSAAIARSSASLPSSASAGSVSTFEDLGLPANSYNNNAGPGGFFVSGGNAFNNTFSPAFGGIWSGWATSSMTDTTTPGASLLPPIDDLRATSARVALAVALAAAHDGVAGRPGVTADGVDAAMWKPQYAPVRAV